MVATLKLTSWYGAEMLSAIDRTMQQRMATAAELVATSAKQSMHGTGSPHVPSAPGEPPAVDTGALRTAIHATVVTAGHRVRGYVVSPSRQAHALEYGYAPHGLAPRPYLRPALARSLPRVRAILAAPVTLVGAR